MGINKREQEALEQKAKTKKIIIIVAVVVIIISLIVISIVLNNRNKNIIKGVDNTNTNSNNSNSYDYKFTGSGKELENKILEADRPVLVDYYADWCGPCVMMAPIMEELKNEQEEFYVVKVDVDKNQELSMKAGASSIPYFVLYNNGKVIASTIGYQSKESLINFVNSNIQK